jgi:hypothetical protein
MSSFAPGQTEMNRTDPMSLVIDVTPCLHYACLLKTMKMDPHAEVTGIEGQDVSHENLDPSMKNGYHSFLISWAIGIGCASIAS